MSTPLVVALRELTAADGAIAGGKGANLGELVRGGFNVPDGFVLTTAAYEDAAAGIDTNDPIRARTALAAALLRPDVAVALSDAYRALGGGPVAVRSSATAEDLPEASFAGQQDTFLDVTGEDSLRDAVRRCWASLWNDRAVAYRRTHDVRGPVAHRSCRLRWSTRCCNEVSNVKWCRRRSTSASASFPGRHSDAGC